MAALVFRHFQFKIQIPDEVEGGVAIFFVSHVRCRHHHHHQYYEEISQPIDHLTCGGSDIDYTTIKRFDMDRIPGQVGYLLLNEDGAVLSSSGELENDEKSADVIMGLINLTSQIDPIAFPDGENFKKLSLTYDDHCYIICLSNRKIHVVKKNLNNTYRIAESA